ncbi:Bax inhibitor-1/YccA family protein [Porphyromonas gingivicanis]|nr:Bax inhibitor-1/YccA family protein [Porphyromonas gingivicanis]
MNNYWNQNKQTPPSYGAYEVDATRPQYVVSTEDVNKLFRNVFVWMTAALGLTGVTSYLVAFTPLFYTLITTPFLFWGVVIAELGLVFFLSARLHKISFITASLCMTIYSVLNGLTLSFIFAAYTASSIISTFFITAGTFGAMALIGTFTKKDLSSWSRYLIMGVVGLIIASVVNMFLKSSGFEWVISIVGVLIFTVLTAVDTNKIKNMLREYDGVLDGESLRKIALMGSLQLYLDFINLFLYLLRFLGRRN